MGRVRVRVRVRIRVRDRVRVRVRIFSPLRRLRCAEYRKARSSKSPNAKPERERECAKVKTFTYSPSTDSYYNKIYMLCGDSFRLKLTLQQCINFRRSLRLV